jgi:hypothetical protein
MRAIYFTLDSVGARKQLVERTMLARRCTLKERTLMRQLIKAVEATNRYRRVVAHVHIWPRPDRVVQAHFKKITKQPRRSDGAPYQPISRATIKRQLAAVEGAYKAAEVALAELRKPAVRAMIKARAKRRLARLAAARRQKTEEQPAAEPRRQSESPPASPEA